MTPYARPAVWTVLAMGIFSASHALSKINLQILPPSEVLGLANLSGFLFTLFFIAVRRQWSLVRLVPDLHTLLGILLIATSGILLLGGGKKA